MRIGISASSMNAWESCRRKLFYYKTVPFTTSIAFSFGLAFEHGVESLIKTRDKDKSINDALNKFKTGQGDIYDIGYREFERKELLKGKDVKDRIYKKFLKEKTEEEVDRHLDLLPDMIIRCKDKLDELGLTFKSFQTQMVSFEENGMANDARFDGIVEKDGKTYIFELKSYKNLIPIENLQFTNQLLNYASVARKKGFEIDGIMFCQNRKVKLESPKVNKNGSLSTAKTQKCDPEDYWDKAIEIYGEDDIPDNVIETYEELLNKNPAVKIDILRFSDKQLDIYDRKLNVMSGELKDIMTLIKNDPTKAKELCYPSFGNACNMCNHELECRKDMLGK